MDYYCNQKFWWLSVDPESKTYNSCCAARSQKIDLKWIEQHPGQLFNSPWLVKEREDMLQNKPVASCETACWQPEQNQLPSRRQKMMSTEVLYTDTHADPKMLSVIIGRDCNLDCVYCCKQYSTSWLRDIKQNGAYLDDERFQLNVSDQLYLKAGQNIIKQTQSYQTILNELCQIKNVEELNIVGGEPFLSNYLLDLINHFDCKITINTGLGVNTERLRRIADQLHSHVEIFVSAETTGSLYEFIRHGNSWNQFLTNLDVLQKRFKVDFSSVVSNLTIFGLEQFQKQFGYSKVLLFCNDPNYLNACVLDDESRQRLQATEFLYNNTQIQNNIKQSATEQQIQNVKTYIREYARRRQLTYDMFPASFVQWIHRD